MIKKDPLNTPEYWVLHSVSERGVTFHCYFDYDDIEGALESFKQAMRPVMDVWPLSVTRMSITLD